LPRAYVLFSVSSGAEDQVQKDLQDIEGVQEVYVSYGVYDVIVKINTDSMEKLKELVSYRLRKVDNIRSTLTLILFEE